MKARVAGQHDYLWVDVFRELITVWRVFTTFWTVAQLWQRDRAKLDAFSINVQRYSQNHAQNWIKSYWLRMVANWSALTPAQAAPLSSTRLMPMKRTTVRCVWWTSPRAGAMRPYDFADHVFVTWNVFEVVVLSSVCRADINMVLRLFRHNF